MVDRHRFVLFQNQLLLLVANRTSMHDRYENPLLTRYASNEMAAIWSAQTKHGLWRRLWIALAEAEQELGLDIKSEQIEELKGTVDQIDFERAVLVVVGKTGRRTIMLPPAALAVLSRLTRMGPFLSPVGRGKIPKGNPFLI